MTRRLRLDQELVRRNLVSSRTSAAAAVESGIVLVNGAIADKSSRLVAPSDAIILAKNSRKFVSRAGEKLEAALLRFGINVTDKKALDIGASTGGFTDCLLAHGAASVCAVDVGHSQLHEKIQSADRVRWFEGLHIKDADPKIIGGPFELIVADLSFISLTAVSDAIKRHCVAGTELILLVKPQFEAGRSEVNRGQGIIKDEQVRQRVLQEVRTHYEDRGFTVIDTMDSPVAGASGNIEFLMYLRFDDRGSR